MNQFHTPSFGDEVFEMNETPMEQTQHQTASRRISRLSSLDHSTLNHVDDDEDLDHMDYDKTNTYATNNLLSANQVQQPQQQQQQEVFTPPPPQQNLPQQSPVTPPSKPLAPYALFFRDTMTAIKQQNPACTLEQITSIAMNMWESIDEKQKSVYDQRHEQEKREYLRQLRDYQRNQQLDETMPNPEQSQQQQQQEQHLPQLQPQEEQQLPQNDVQPSIPPLSIPATETETTTVQSQTQQPPDQIQLLTEAAAVQKCTRDQCNKPAIINPDWEDEYCSNECVVIHCHNVFREWARSLQNSPT